MSRSLSYSTPKPTGGYELWSWIFMRLSGLVLLLLALGHLVLMHLIHNVDAIDYNFVAGRYAALGWRVYDGALLLLAMIHGLNGLRIILDDHLAHWAGYRWVIRALYAVAAVFLLAGLYVVICFQPVRSAP